MGKITPKKLLNKIILSKIFLLFEIAFNKIESDNIQSNNGYCNTSPNIKPTANLVALSKLELVLNRIEIILKKNSEIENDEFFSNLLSFLDKFEELINYYR